MWQVGSILVFVLRIQVWTGRGLRPAPYMLLPCSLRQEHHYPHFTAGSTALER